MATADNQRLPFASKRHPRLTLSAFRRVARLVGCGVLLLCTCRGTAQAPQPGATATPLQSAIAQGSNALQQGDAAGAEQAFRRALALDPRSVPILNNLAIALAREQKEPEAIALYKRALSIKPDDAITKRNLGVAYFRAKQYQAALPLLQAVATTAPTFQALALVGFDLFALDRYAPAEHYLQAAHALQPDDVETLDLLGKAYLRTGDYTGMSRVFAQMMAINPASPEAHAMLAMAYDKLYREADAIREFQAALAADPNYPGIHTGLGIIYWRNDQIDQAEQQFRQALAQHPDDPVANCTLGRILRRRGDLAQAVPLLESALRANPSYRDALVALGEVRIPLGDANGAIDVLQRAVALDPKDAEAHYLLGSALNLAGRYAEGAKQRLLSGQIREQQREHPNTTTTPAN
jgi:tetratricopeptide (TPR) repeat protein